MSEIKFDAFSEWAQLALVDGFVVGRLQRDRSGNYYCPNCGGQHEFHYEEIPEHRRNYTMADDIDATEFMPAIRDYECSDCGFTWSLDPNQEQ